MGYSIIGRRSEGALNVEMDRFEVPRINGTMKWASECKTLEWRPMGSNRVLKNFLSELDRVHFYVRFYALRFRGVSIFSDESHEKVRETTRWLQFDAIRVPTSLQRVVLIGASGGLQPLSSVVPALLVGCIWYVWRGWFVDSPGSCFWRQISLCSTSLNQIILKTCSEFGVRQLSDTKRQFIR